MLYEVILLFWFWLLFDFVIFYKKFIIVEGVGVGINEWGILIFFYKIESE